MDSLLASLPAQFLRRSETAAFIVALESYFSVSLGDNVFAELPSPPDHLDRETVEECRTIAGMLAVARKSQCESVHTFRGMEN